MANNHNHSNLFADHLVDISSAFAPHNDRKDSKYVSDTFSSSYSAFFYIDFS